MRANKLAIILTGIFTTVSFALIFVFPKEMIIHEIALACFGSALLGVVVAYTAYRAERRSAMECFWEEAYELNRKIKMFDHLNNDTPEKINYSSVHFFMDQYIRFAKIDMRELSNAYGRLDFLFGNITIRKKAYEEIYKQIRDFQNECINNASHFDLFEKGEGNLDVCIAKLRELDHWVFEERECEVYNALYDRLGRSLEDFRIKIYGCEPEYEKPRPIITCLDKQTFQSFKNETTANNSSTIERVRELEAGWITDEIAQERVEDFENDNPGLQEPNTYSKKNK